MRRAFLYIVAFVLFLTGSFAQSKEQITVLTSLEAPKRHYFLRPKNYSIDDYVENKFNRSFDQSSVQIKYLHRASAFDLHQALQDENNLAVFWISHAASKIGLFSGSIVDVHGNDLKDIFQQINPNIMYVGVIGCSAQEIIEEYQESGYYDNNDELTLHSFNKKVSLRRGLITSIKESAKVIGKKTRSFTRKNGYMTRIQKRIVLKDELLEREISSQVNQSSTGHVLFTNINLRSSAMVKVNGVFIGLIDHKDQDAHLDLPDDLQLSTERNKLTLHYLNGSGQENVANPNVLDISLRYQDKTFNPKILLNVQGLPYGKNTNFFYF